MKKLISKPIVALLVVFVVLGGIGLVGPMTAQAATSPSLGAAETYSILAQTGITGTGTISGDVENNGTGAAITALTAVMVGGTIYSSDAVATLGGAPTTLLNPAVQADTLSANLALSAATNADANCIGGVLADNTDLSTLAQPLAPGLYCSAGNFLLTGGLTLAGTTGTWIFRTVTGLTTSVGSSITGGDPCNIWWGVGSLATINGDMTGSILAGTGVHFNTPGTTLNGRALAYGGDVTLTGQTISAPVCTALAPGGSTVYTGTVNVVKTVVGGTKMVADFPLFINGNLVTSGVTNVFTINNTTLYNISETVDPNYIQTFSGDCDSNGDLYLMTGGNRFCVITNTFRIVPVVVPPIISVVKVPSPLSLPAGSGPVNYTYTARNIGTVPINNVTMIGDSCSPITFTSGDTNSNGILDLTESWIYNCSTTLTETHTNTVTVTGWANGISATDVASATVVVGTPVVPPLINVTKVPSPLALSAAGGQVTYTEKITNPGTVALSNVTLRDDKCSPMRYISGDTNGDTKLDVAETWTYTCSTNLTATTTNTAVATGEANGLTVTDIAIATVVVATAVPALPNTGFAPYQGIITMIVLVGILAVMIGYYFVQKKQTS